MLSHVLEGIVDKSECYPCQEMYIKFLQYIILLFCFLCVCVFYYKYMICNGGEKAVVTGDTKVKSSKELF